MNIKFILFGDGSASLKSAAKRIATEAQESNLFSLGVSKWKLTDVFQILPSKDIDKFEKHIRLNPRGLGLWFWKSVIVDHELRKLNTNDYLLYLDVGCQLNINPLSLKRFSDYMDLVSNSGGLFMQLFHGEFGIKNLSELAFTKKDLIDSLKLPRNKLQEPQIQSGIIFLKRTSDALSLTGLWRHMCIKNDFSFLRDPDKENHYPEFVEHRWEQSILSLLVKQSKLSYISDETFFYPNWKMGRNFPIFAMRNSSGGDALRKNMMDLTRMKIGNLQRKGLRIKFKNNYYL